jgi:hypothetical protein
VFKIVFEERLERFEIIHGHSFDQKLLIVAEKEEASTLSHTFTRFEDGLLIALDVWMEAFFDIEVGIAIQTSHMSKDIWSILSTNSLFVDNHETFILKNVA